MDLTFNTKIDKQELSVDDFMIIDHAYLSWSAVILTKDYGIAGLSARVPDQDITIKIEEEIDEEGDTQEREEVISLKDVEVLYERNSDIDDSRSLGLIPIRISVTNGHTTVTFGTSDV